MLADYRPLIAASDGKIAMSQSLMPSRIPGKRTSDAAGSLVVMMNFARGVQCFAPEFSPSEIRYLHMRQTPD